jgi:GNAT superfamily N-acetyltransferase
MSSHLPAESAFRVEPSEDVELNASILEEVAAWVALEGLRAWRPGWFAYPDGPGIPRLRRDAESGSLYIALLDDFAAASISLLDNDPLYWPDAADDALYLHRFAVRRAAAGIGRLAVEWTIEESRRRGRAYVRLDCLADSPRICSYYESCGFTRVGDAKMDDVPLFLYERHALGAPPWVDGSSELDIVGPNLQKGAVSGHGDPFSVTPVHGPEI